MKKVEHIRLFLVDDHQVIREGLASIFNGEPDIEVVGEASSGEEAIEKLEKVVPDVVLMDVSMPDSDGFRAAERIMKAEPRIAIIMLTGYESELYAAKSLRVGASGYLTKDSPSKYLINAIRLVASGGTVWKRDQFPGSRREANIKGDIAPLTTEVSAELFDKAFTAREMEILRLLGEGYGNKQIAATLNLADATVKKHIKSIMQNFGAKNRTQAALFAVKMGLI